MKAWKTKAERKGKVKGKKVRYNKRMASRKSERNKTLIWTSNFSPIQPKTYVLKVRAKCGLTVVPSVLKHVPTCTWAVVTTFASLVACVRLVLSRTTESVSLQVAARATTMEKVTITAMSSKRIVIYGKYLCFRLISISLESKVFMLIEFSLYFFSTLNSSVASKFV